MIEPMEDRSDGLNRKLLYCGDGDRSGAASYLGGVLARAGIPFEHVASAAPFPPGALGSGLGAVILSDYPSRNLSQERIEELCAAVRAGLGLLLLGGWESYVGRSAEYQRTPLAALLPVRLAGGDDRRNTWRPCVVVPGPAHPHPITGGLPLDRDLPCVAGFNAFEALPGAAVALELCEHAAAPTAGGVAFVPVARHPLLVVGAAGAGRVACFASDPAPHWVGGLVDWGAPRIEAAADGCRAVEVGCWYLRLFERMVRWVLG
jgi:hypothetical protein